MDFLLCGPLLTWNWGRDLARGLLCRQDVYSGEGSASCIRIKLPQLKGGQLVSSTPRVARGKFMHSYVEQASCSLPSSSFEITKANRVIGGRSYVKAYGKWSTLNFLAFEPSIRISLAPSVPPGDGSWRIPGQFPWIQARQRVLDLHADHLTRQVSATLS